MKLANAILNFKE